MVVVLERGFGRHGVLSLMVVYLDACRMLSVAQFKCLRAVMPMNHFLTLQSLWLEWQRAIRKSKQTKDERFCKIAMAFQAQYLMVSALYWNDRWK